MLNSQFPNPLMNTATARPQHPLLITDKQTWTAAQLLQEVRSRATFLQNHGVGPGTRLLLSGPWNQHAVFWIHAAAWQGALAIPCPMPSQSLPLEAWHHKIQQLPHQVAITWQNEVDLGQAFLVVEQCSEAPAPERFWQMCETLLLLQSSGSTARPKSIEITTQQLLFNAFGSAIRIGHSLDDLWLCCLPLNHIGGLAIHFRCAFYGTTIIQHQQFEPIKVARLLDQGKVSLISLVPSMLQAVLDARPHNPFPKKLRAILLGGAATSKALLERCQQIQAPIAITWGMTECCSQVATRFPGDTRPDSGVGPALPFTSVTVDQSTLDIHGPTAKGSFKSQDQGYIDQHGNVHVLGRADSVIVSGGENISLSEIEQLLGSHENIAEAAVIGVEHEHWGQRPVAFIVPKKPLDTDDITAWCRSQLASFKVPDTIHCVSDLPKTSLGKVEKLRLESLLTQLSSEAGKQERSING